MDIYAYQRPLGKISDITELRDAFIAIYDQIDKTDAVRFGLLLGKHLLEMTQTTPAEEIDRAFDAMQRWLDGKASYHEARNISLRHLYEGARRENDLVRERLYRTMAQIACIPHVKYHALWATDFAVTLINRMHPGDASAVRKERETHIQLLKMNGGAQ